MENFPSPRHFEDSDLVMGLYVKEYFDPFRPDDLIHKLIDRCCTIRQNINEPILAGKIDSPVNIMHHKANMTLVGVVTGFVELRFVQYSFILEPGDMVFMPPGSTYLVLPVLGKDFSTENSLEKRTQHGKQKTSQRSNENIVKMQTDLSAPGESTGTNATKNVKQHKYEARLVYAEYPSQTNYF